MISRSMFVSLGMVLAVGCSSSTEGDATGSGGTGADGSGGGGAEDTGGNAGEGTVGTGGQGGGGTALSTRCDAACEAIVGADCANGPDSAGCLYTCRALASSDACTSQGNEYFDCVDENGVECNAAGDPVAATCGLAWLAAIGCAVTENPNPAMEQPCADHCDAIEAADCVSSAPRDECYTNCLWQGATGLGCDDEWATYLECGATNGYICLLGYGAPQSCLEPWLAHADCLSNAGN